MIKILITGKSGSGKNELSNMLAKKLGYKHIDLDVICRTCYDEKLVREKVRQYFGNGVFNGEEVDRKKLGSVVFNDKTKLEWLSNLNYDYVIDQVDKEIKCSTVPVILNYVLLPITKYWKEKDVFKILCESTSDEDRVNILTQRDNVSKEYILARDKGAHDYKNEKFDYIFKNDYTNECISFGIKEIIDLLEKRI